MIRHSLQTLDLKYESDVVRIRQKARLFAKYMGFEQQDQVRIATAVSEIARNAYEYANGGRVEFAIKDRSPQSLEITVADDGPGISDINPILSGSYVSHTGMGIGMAGARKLVDQMLVETGSDGKGTKVTLSKQRPTKLSNIPASEFISIVSKSSEETDGAPLNELQAQNRELFLALEELNLKQESLARANEELANTNKGVLALYTELDEQALALRRANQTKTAFLSNMTHEFRSPLNTILNISSLLLDKNDGIQNLEHITQVQFIQKSAASLSVLVNDLLDIAKVEAGKILVRPNSFWLSEVFSSLRGLMKPLLVPENNVELIFEMNFEDAELYTDEGKLSQILKNLISNALKYTRHGEVRISCYHFSDEEIAFRVQDTGIGISHDDMDKIFEEFFQVDSLVQKKFKGTGLGLPLSDKLARLLGGSILVESEPNVGSKFTLVIPKRYAGAAEADYVSQPPEPAATPVSVSNPDYVLIIDDNQADRYYLKNLLKPAGLTIVESADPVEGLKKAKQKAPSLLFLDLNMPKMSGFEVLKELMGHPKTRSIPVVVHSSQNLAAEDKQYFSQIGVDFLSKNKAESDDQASQLDRILKKHRLKENLL